jgi:hypothetical protein
MCKFTCLLLFAVWRLLRRSGYSVTLVVRQDMILNKYMVWVTVTLIHVSVTCDDPLYILPHSKTVLTQAINNDTQFLASQSVMDYSLLVGLDKECRELVVGIIGMYCVGFVMSVVEWVCGHCSRDSTNFLLLSTILISRKTVLSAKRRFHICITLRS